MNKIERAEAKKLIAERDELRDLLGAFGASLSGWNPGVSAKLPGKRGSGYWGEALSFDGVEWAWLKPLLVELRDRRLTAPDYIRFSGKAHPNLDV